MNKIQPFLDKYDLSIRGYQKKKGIQVIDTNKGKYVIKNRFSQNDHLYSYLDNKNFPYLLYRESIDDYEIFPYVNEVELPLEEKAIELVYILSILHNKTTFYREVSMDQVKEIYEEISDKLSYLFTYYHDLQDVIEQKVYMNPAEYLLIRNISFVYSSLEFSKQQLEKWYQYKKNQKKERVVLLHGRPCLDHLLIGKDKKLISWNHYKRDIPIYDFVYFYRHDYMDVEMSTLYGLYQSKFMFTEEEYLLFLTLLTIPEKLEWNGNHYSNCEKTFRFIKYITKTRDFVLKEDEEQQKENKDKFNE